MHAPSRGINVAIIIKPQNNFPSHAGNYNLLIDIMVKCSIEEKKLSKKKNCPT